MWIFTEIADWFDKTRRENDKFLDDIFQGWIDYAVQHGDDPGFVPALHNVAIYAGVATLDAVNMLTGTVASGFLDTLRIGDGVQKGGWGYGQDALRLLVVAGPLLRVARFGLAKFVAVEPGGEICTWFAARSALVATGTRHFITLGKVLESAGVELADVANYRGAWTEEAAQVMQLLGADVRAVASGGGPVAETLLRTLGDNVNSVVVFSVKWLPQTGTAVDDVGHTMVAFRNALTGALQILDRSGRIVSSLADLESTYTRFPGITNAVFYDMAEAPLLLVKNSTIVTLLDNGLSWAVGIQATEAWLTSDDGTGFMFTNARWIYDALGLEVRSVPFRVEKHTSMQVPVRPVLTKSALRTQTVCTPTFRNSDSPPDAPTQSCDVLTVYTVQPGDTLSAIARSVYGDPKRWRGIAAANQVRDPTRLRSGALLVIP